MTRKFSFPESALRICVDDTAGSRFCGRLVSARLSAPIPFSDITSLMLTIEDVLNAQNFPQAYQQSRTFAQRQPRALPLAASEEAQLPLAAVSAAQGALSTFSIQVTSRQHSSWQGFVDWLDGEPTESFSSVLQLLRMIHDRLCA